MKTMNKKAFGPWAIFVLLALVSIVGGHRPAAALRSGPSVLSAVWKPGSGLVSNTTPPVTITSCQDITQPGSYVLGNSLTAAAGSTCLNIHDTANVQLDCKGFGITVSATVDSATTAAVNLNNATQYSVKNCTLNTALVTGNKIAYGLHITNSPSGTVSNNTINGGTTVEVKSSNNLSIANNVINNATLMVSDSNNLTIENNTSALDLSKFYSSNIQVSSSKGSIIQSNQLNGGWDGIARSFADEVGADDGIILENVSDSIIQKNTMSNYWDAGIETLNSISNVKFLNNRVTNAFVAGIGAWHYSSFRGNTVSGNITDNSTKLFYFKRSGGLLPTEQYVYFKDNTFSGNKLLKSRTYDSSVIDLTSEGNGIPSSQFILGNNIFSDNDFLTTSFAPTFNPASMIVDGGGNICGSIFQTPDFPLHCGATISIFTNESLQGKFSQYFAATFRVSGGPGNSYTITASSPPPGLQVTQNYCLPIVKCDKTASQNSITLYGIPSRSGTFQFTVNASDSFGNSKSQSFTIAISGKPQLRK